MDIAWTFQPGPFNLGTFLTLSRPMNSSTGNATESILLQTQNITMRDGYPWFSIISFKPHLI